MKITNNQNKIFMKDREQITIRLPVKLVQALKQEADKKGYTLTDLIVFILWNYVH